MKYNIASNVADLNPTFTEKVKSGYDSLSQHEAFRWARFGAVACGAALVFFGIYKLDGIISGSNSTPTIQQTNPDINTIDHSATKFNIAK